MDNNRSNQLNSNNSAYWQSRGYDDTPSQGTREEYTSSHPTPDYSKADLDNKSNQLNPNNPTYYSSRGTSKK